MVGSGTPILRNNCGYNVALVINDDDPQVTANVPQAGGNNFSVVWSSLLALSNGCGNNGSQVIVNGH